MASNSKSTEEELDKWNPMEDDYNDPAFNSYQRGPARSLPKAGINRERTTHSVFIAGIPLDLSEDGLKNLFSKAGRVVSVKIPLPKPGRTDNIAFVNYDKQASAEQAIKKFNNYSIGKGFQLRVSNSRKEKRNDRAMYAARLAGEEEEDQGSGKENRIPHPPATNDYGQMRYPSNSMYAPAPSMDGRAMPPMGAIGGMPLTSGYGRGTPNYYPPPMPPQPVYDYNHGMMSPSPFGRGAAAYDYAAQQQQMYANQGYGDYGMHPGFDPRPRFQLPYGGGFGDQVGTPNLDRALSVSLGRPKPEAKMPNLATTKCSVCGKATTKKCTKCKTYYCSSACQTNDWPKHKELCAKLAELAKFDGFDVSVGDDFMDKIQTLLEIGSNSSGADVDSKKLARYQYEQAKKVFLSELGTQILEERTFYKVVVTYVMSPREFYIRSREDRAFAKCMADLEKVYKKSAPSGYTPDENEVVVVHDGEGYKRGAISGKSDTQYEVQLIDEGKVIKVELNKLRRANEEFSKLPCQAILCALTDVTPVDHSFQWPEPATTFFQDWCRENASTLDGCIISSMRDKKIIQLKSKGEKLSDIMITKGHAADRKQDSQHGTRKEERKPQSDVRPKDTQQQHRQQQQQQQQHQQQQHQTVEKIQVKSLHVLFHDGKQFECMPIEVYSTQDFWIQVYNERKKTEYENLFKAICACYIKKPENTSFRPEKGDFIAAPFQGEYSRAVVLDIRGDKFRVRFVDFGNVATVTLNQVHPLEKDFTSLFTLAIKCALSKVPDDSSLVEPLKQMVGKGDMWKIRVVRKIGEVLEVEAKAKDGSSVNEVLQKKCAPKKDSPPQKNTTQTSLPQKRDIVYAAAKPAPAKSPARKTPPPQKNTTQTSLPQKRDIVYAAAKPAPAKSPARKTPPKQVSPPKKNSPKMSNGAPVSKAPSLEQWPVEMEKPFDALVTEVRSLQEFYIQPFTLAEELQALSAAVDSHYRTNTPPPVANPSVGDLVVAPFFNEYYRAQVTEVTDKVTVQFVDFGNADAVAKDQVYKMKEEFFKYPQIAKKCKLDAVVETTEAATPKLRELTDTVLVKMIVKKLANDVPVVEIRGEDGQSVATKLIDAGCARKVQEEAHANATPTPRTPIQTPKLSFRVESLHVGLEVLFVAMHVVGPGEFYGHIVEESSFQELSAVLMATYGSKAADPAFRPNVGDYVAALFEGEWCRANVLRVSGQEYTLKYIDFGNDANAKLDQIRELDPANLAVQVPAVKCRLANVCGTENGQWSANAVQVFKELVIANSPYQIKVANVEDGIANVEIFDMEKTVDYKNQLLASGLAKDTSSNVVGQMPELVAPAPTPAPAQPAPTPAPAQPAQTPAAAQPAQTPKASEPAVRQLPSLLDRVHVGQKISISPLNLESVEQFYAVIAQVLDMKKASGLMDDMEVFDKRPEDPNFRPRVGDIIAAHWSVDKHNRWHRAKVFEAGGKELEVFYMDNGNTGRTDYKNIRKLDAKFGDVHQLVLPCKLHGLENGEKRKAFEHLQYITQTVGVMEGTVHEIEDGVISVDIPGVMIQLGFNEATGTYKMSSLPSIGASWEIGHKEPVFIHYTVNPGKFFAQPFSMMVKYDTLGNEMTSDYQIQPVNQDFKPDVMDIVVAPFSDDGKFYRSVILQKEGEVAHVRFIDWGNDQTVDIQRVYKMRQCFMKLPYGAVECELAGVEPAGGQWSDEAINTFAMASNQQKSELIVMEKGDVLKVQIMISETESIQDILVAKGLAKLPGKKTPARPTTVSAVIGAEGDPSTVVIKKSQLKVYKLGAGEEEMGLIMEVGDPNKFYVQVVKADFIEHATNLNAEIADYVSKVTEPYMPKSGELVIAQWAGDWYRAAVLGTVEPENIQVQFIDYGNCDVVSHKVVRRFDRKFMSTPALGIPCTLANVKAPAGVFTEEQVTLYKSLIEVNKRYRIKVLSVIGEVASVELYDADDPDVCINKDLVKLGECDEPGRQVLMADTLPRVKLQDNTPTGVCVSSFNEEEFYLNCSQSIEGWWEPQAEHAVNGSVRELKILPIEIESWSSFSTFSGAIHESCSLQPYEKFQPVIGEVIAAQYDGVWYRAHVQEIDETAGTLKVFYIDFGNAEIVKLENTRLLPELVQQPRQGIRCVFQNVKPVGGKWSQEARDFVVRICGAGSVVVTSLRCEDDNYVVKLEVDTPQGAIDVSDELVRAGHAETTSNSSSADTDLRRQLQQKDDLLRRLQEQLAAMQMR